MTTNNNELEFPRRYIYNDADMERFKDSKAKRELLKFTEAMGRACTNSNYTYNPNRPYIGLSPSMAALLGSLQELETWTSQLVPDTTKQARFGNPVFKEWHARLKTRSASIIHNILQVCNEEKYKNRADTDDALEFDQEMLIDAIESGKKAANTVLELSDIENITMQRRVQELSVYLQTCFGHAIRLDYGTGHESSFQVLLFCLCKLGTFNNSSNIDNQQNVPPPTVRQLQAVTLALYHAYLRVTRTIQTDYMLEPAGSHGVWGLDDYHCLPFYFGACQMQNTDYKPDCIHNQHLLDEHGDVYLYLSCIRYIKQLKKGVPFFEHSPMLDDISQLQSWSKVSSGLLKLYQGEVLNKRQVVQHFVFGDIFAADWKPSQDAVNDAPSETFRQSGTGRAPWAGGVPSTQAPWANKSGSSTSAVMPPTKAPWAK